MDVLSDVVGVVAGGTGSVGEGIVHSLLTQGATVVVPYRNEAKRQSLVDYTKDIHSGTLICWPAELSSQQSMAEFKSRILKEFGRVDLGVACLGGWYYGYSLHNMPDDHWEKILNDNLKTHFLVQRTLVSLMHDKNKGVYVMVNGGAAEFIAPESGAVSIMAAAQLMIARVLKQEALGTDIRVHSLIGYNPIKTRDRRAEVMEEWFSAEEIGEYIVGLYKGTVPNINKTIHRL